MADTVKVVISHNQEIDGKEYKAGADATVDAQLARTLVRRGAVQIKSEKDAAKVIPAPADTKGAGK